MSDSTTPLGIIGPHGRAGRAASPRRAPHDARVLKAYEPDGLTQDGFLSYGATARTLRQFLAADEELDQIVRDILVPAP